MYICAYVCVYIYLCNNKEKVMNLGGERGKLEEGEGGYELCRSGTNI